MNLAHRGVNDCLRGEYLFFALLDLGLGLCIATESLIHKVSPHLVNLSLTGLPSRKGVKSQL